MNDLNQNQRFLGMKPEVIFVGGVVGVGILVWEFLTRMWFSEIQIIFPLFSDIVREGITIVVEGTIFPHLWATAKAVGLSFFLAGLIGIPLGTLLGSSRLLARAVEPIMYYVSTIPKIMFYPILLMVLGIGLESKIGIGLLSALFPVTVNTLTGAQGIRSNLLEVARSHGATTWQIFTKVYIPSMIPYIVNGLRLGMGVAIIGVVLGEHFVSQVGLGHQASAYFSSLQIARLYAVLIIIFFLAFVLNQALLWIQNDLEEKGYGSGKRGEVTGF